MLNGRVISRLLQVPSIDVCKARRQQSWSAHTHTHTLTLSSLTQMVPSDHNTALHYFW